MNTLTKYGSVFAALSALTITTMSAEIAAGDRELHKAVVAGEWVKANNLIDQGANPCSVEKEKAFAEADPKNPKLVKYIGTMTVLHELALADNPHHPFILSFLDRVVQKCGKDFFNTKAVLGLAQGFKTPVALTPGEMAKKYAGELRSWYLNKTRYPIDKEILRLLTEHEHRKNMIASYN